MDNEIKEAKKGFGYRLRIGLGFIVNVDFHLGCTFILLMLSQIPYYIVMGRIVTRLMSLTSDQIMELLAGDYVGSLLREGEQSSLTVALLVSVVAAFFFSMYYGVMFLRQRRHPGRPTEILIFRALISIIIILMIRAFIFTGLYYMCNVSLFIFLVLLLRPLSVYSTCCRIDSQQTFIGSLRSSFAVMKGQMLRSSIYTALCWIIVVSAGTALGTFISVLIPAHTVTVMSVTLAVTNTVYIIAYTRMFISMYAEAVPAEANTETESND